MLALSQQQPAAVRPGLLLLRRARRAPAPAAFAGRQLPPLAAAAAARRPAAVAAPRTRQARRPLAPAHFSYDDDEKTRAASASSSSAKDSKQQLQQQSETPPKPVAAAATAPATSAATTTPPSEDPSYPPGFLARRWVLFAGLVLGYLSLYLSRLTLTYAAPVMVADPSLGLTKTQIGLLASAFPAAYGISKFTSGMLGAAFSPRMMLVSAVAVTGGINLAFGFSTGVAVWTALWALNGALQGAGAPACAMLLSRWYPPRERGTYWGLWNCLGSNFGGFITPLLVGGVAAAVGWRAGFFIPGAWGLVVGAALLWALADDPTRLGFPPADPAEAQRAKEAAEKEEREHGRAVASLRLQKRRLRQEERSKSRAAAAASGTSAAAVAASLSSSEEDDEDEEFEDEQDDAQVESAAERERRSKKAALARSMAEVCRSKGIWLLALAYFCVYVVRQGATSWLVFYLIEEKGVENAAQAAARVSGLELGGLAGGTLAGVFSDRAIRAAKAKAEKGKEEKEGGAGAAGAVAGVAGAAAARGGGNKEPGLVGKRVRVTMAYSAATLFVLAALRALPAHGCPPALLWLTIAALGFCIYGPQMLIGLCGAELVAPASVGASQGVLGLVSYMGAANAGAPLALIVSKYGWEAYFFAMAAASVLAVALLAPLADARSRVQEEEEGARAAAGKAA
jgi:sugar phosphate permease